MVQLTQEEKDILLAIHWLKGKCTHCGEKTNPAYIDLAKLIAPAGHVNKWIPGIRETLAALEKKNAIVGEGSYYVRGTHGGAGAKKWRLADGVQMCEDCGQMGFCHHYDWIHVAGRDRYCFATICDDCYTRFFEQARKNPAWAIY